VAGDFRVTIRRRGRTERSTAADLAAALDAVEARLRELAPAIDRRAERAFVRDVEPVQQVALRGEVAGPGRVRGGVDVRGDGSAEAFTGRVVRRLVAQEPGEDAYAALRRALGRRV
jgi:hypothetical protein